MSFHKPQIQIQIQTTGTARLQRTTLTSPARPEHLEAVPPEQVQATKLPQILLIQVQIPIIQIPGQILKLQFPPLILLAQIQTLTFPKHL